MQDIYLKLMTNKMYHQYFKEYKNDPDLYLNKDEYYDFVYTEEWVNKYIAKQKNLGRICLGIMQNNNIIGEIKLYDILPKKHATLGISMKNNDYKNKGYGTKAEQLVIDYAFNKLNLKTLYADCIITNTRSQKVLEKVGFKLIKTENNYKYYKLDK